jgi:predicted dithiol-disulfide oxidoreductase (DUF899 family)
LSQQRRELPWVKLDKTYTFKGPNGYETLSELFAGRRQLLVYHFMFGPDWDEGCPSCSFWADNYAGAIVHLNHRDVTLVTISHHPAPSPPTASQRLSRHAFSVPGLRHAAPSQVPRQQIVSHLVRHV